MGLGEIRLGEMGLGEMGLGEMGQNRCEHLRPSLSAHYSTSTSTSKCQYRYHHRRHFAQLL